MKRALKSICVFYAVISVLFSGYAMADGNYANENSTKGFVYRMYDIALGREPEEAGFNYWVEKLENGEMKAADLVQGFLGSDEYKNLNKSNSQVVTDCYNVMLNRAPDAPGFEYWKERLDVGMTFQSVCSGFVGSTEFSDLAGSYGIAPGTIEITNARDLNFERTAFVNRMYTNCLQREPETEGLEHWCGQLTQGMNGTAIASNFVFSPEFRAKHLSNAEFVNVMYKTILGRECDQAGFDYWKEKLDYTNTREYVLNGFMASKEFNDACTKSGIKIGEPIASPDETDDWQINIELMNLINEIRRANGVHDLTMTTREDLWQDVSMVRAQEIKTLHSSDRPDGRWWSSIINDTGLGYIDYEGTSRKNDTAHVYELWCYGKTEPISFWYTYAKKEIISEEYENFAGAFYPEDNWEMVMYKRLY